MNYWHSFQGLFREVSHVASTDSGNLGNGSSLPKWGTNAKRLSFEGLHFVQNNSSRLTFWTNSTESAAAAFPATLLVREPRLSLWAVGTGVRIPAAPFGRRFTLCYKWELNLENLKDLISIFQGSYRCISSSALDARTLRAPSGVRAVDARVQTACLSRSSWAVWAPPRTSQGRGGVQALGGGWRAVEGGGTAYISGENPWSHFNEGLIEMPPINFILIYTCIHMCHSEVFIFAVYICVSRIFKSRKNLIPRFCHFTQKTTSTFDSYSLLNRQIT